VVSVVIPAHNEERVIGRLLGRLGRSGLDIVVVPNGCTDDTAGVAASFGARVVTSPEASKAAALRLGDRNAHGFPRLYVDADVELGADDVRALVAALERPGVLAAAPARVLDMARRPWPVRWYYDVWTRLPEVRRGLFGRGVIAVGAEGHARLERLPGVIADDLAASLAFAPDERVVVADARVVIRPPRTWGDLLRRRTRAVTGVTQLEAAELDQAGGSARTSPRDLAAMALREPLLVPRLALFVSVTLIARRRARRTGGRTWERDESSRDL
jgi:glycosyltransferase involved in cell wall biosynthesis